MNWITLARPFAARRAIYRQKAKVRWARFYAAVNASSYGQHLDYIEGQAIASETAKEAIEILWSEVIRDLSNKGEDK